MNKSVLISIQPYWVFLIIARIMGWDIPQDKSIEVRKDFPKDPAWNKVVHIYCSKNRKSFNRIPKEYHPLMAKLLGTVIGEFVCDNADEFKCCCVPYKKENNLGYGHFLNDGVYHIEVDKVDEGIVFERPDEYIDSMLKNKDLEKMCLSARELYDYIGLGKRSYGWHISDLKIYDTPKELGEFKKEGYMTEEQWLYALYPNTHCHYAAWAKRFNLARPPQSWCYVEELSE